MDGGPRGVGGGCGDVLFAVQVCGKFDYDHHECGVCEDDDGVEVCFPEYSDVAWADEDGSVDSNEKLLAKLTKDDFIYKLRPRPSKETDSPEFLPFYKWCFNHFRVEQAKNVTADVAMVLMETLLDPAKYKPGYRPEEEHGDEEAGAPRLNHLKVFLEFLRSGPKPPVIITRDQYEQFYFFNKQVPWDLEGYDEATSTCGFSECCEVKWVLMCFEQGQL